MNNLPQTCLHYYSIVLSVAEQYCITRIHLNHAEKLAASAPYQCGLSVCLPACLSLRKTAITPSVSAWFRSVSGSFSSFQAFTGLHGKHRCGASIPLLETGKLRRSSWPVHHNLPKKQHFRFHGKNLALQLTRVMWGLPSCRANWSKIKTKVRCCTKQDRHPLLW